VRCRPDLLDAHSPKGLEVCQLTEEATVPAAHIYMEVQTFTPDCRRFILHRSANAHCDYGYRYDPEHHILCCDLDNGGALIPIITELGATAPSVSPDGQFVYYLLDETEPPGRGRLSLKRVHLDGTGSETLTVIDAPLPGTRYRPSWVYPMTSVSSDNRRVSAQVFLGDGTPETATRGLLIFDVPGGTVSLPIIGRDWVNTHAQFCRSTDPRESHDLLLQEDHGSVFEMDGRIVSRGDPAVGGCDAHVISDDGGNLRDMPWGRNGVEFAQGHQVWRGRTAWAITSTYQVIGERRECRLIESLPAPHGDHRGIDTPGAVRNDISASIPEPAFYHFATDLAGRLLITDTGPWDRSARICLAELAPPGEGPARFTDLLRPRSSWVKGAHIHPFLSPDGRRGFFNSDETGILQAYMICGLEHV